MFFSFTQNVHESLTNYADSLVRRFFTFDGRRAEDVFEEGRPRFAASRFVNRAALLAGRRALPPVALLAGRRAF